MSGYMRLPIEMGNPEETIMQELTDPALRFVTQESVALTYAFLMAQQGNDADWSRINAAIRARWKGRTALERIKKLAWKQLDDWHQRGTAVTPPVDSNAPSVDGLAAGVPPEAES